jgi:hypothetical protein
MPPAVKTVTEYALVVRDGEKTQGVFSHASKNVVAAKLDQLEIAAAEGGPKAPNYQIVKRVCTYPLDADGQPGTQGSTCAETVLVALAALAAVVCAVLGDFGEASLLLAAAAAVPAKFIGRGDSENVLFVNAKVLTPGAATPFSNEFKMGHGWWVMWLHVTVSVVIGTGTGVVAEGLLRLIKKVFFKTDRGEQICNEPGRALYYIGAVKQGARPQITALAAATGDYEVFIPIFFADPRMVRPEDTILNTARYQSVDLEVTLGTVADLFTTVGTSSYTAKINVEVERTYGALHDGAKPFWFVSYDHRPPVDASVQPDIELEKSADLNYKRLYLFTAASGAAGVPWSGDANDVYPTKTNIRDQDRTIEKDRVHKLVQAKNKLDYALETQLAGIEVYDFVKDRSNTAALSSGDKSSLKLELTQTGAAANAIMTLTYEGIRALKG